MRRASPNRRMLWRNLRQVVMLTVMLGLCLGMTACVSVEKLGDHTGDSFRKVFNEQAGGRRRLKRMEAELAVKAAKRFAENRPATSSRPKLIMPGTK